MRNIRRAAQQRLAFYTRLCAAQFAARTKPQAVNCHTPFHCLRVNGAIAQSCLQLEQRRRLRVDTELSWMRDIGGGGQQTGCFIAHDEREVLLMEVVFHTAGL